MCSDEVLRQKCFYLSLGPLLISLSTFRKIKGGNIRVRRAGAKSRLIAARGYLNLPQTTLVSAVGFDLTSIN